MGRSRRRARLRTGELFHTDECDVDRVLTETRSKFTYLKVTGTTAAVSSRPHERKKIAWCGAKGNNLTPWWNPRMPYPTRKIFVTLSDRGVPHVCGIMHGTPLDDRGDAWYCISSTF